MKILLIEDDREAASYLIQALDEAGHVTHHATDGETGYAMASSMDYDVLIVDRMLPRRDGLSIIESLRAEDNHTPALILSALGEVQVLRGMAIISVVGRGFVRQTGLAGRIFQALRDVNVVMISFGASDVNVSFVVNQDKAEHAVRLLHQEFFEGARPAESARPSAAREAGSGGS